MDEVSLGSGSQFGIVRFEDGVGDFWGWGDGECAPQNILFIGFLISFSEKRSG